MRYGWIRLSSIDLDISILASSGMMLLTCSLLPGPRFAVRGLTPSHVLQYTVMYQCVIAQANNAAFFMDGSLLAVKQVRHLCSVSARLGLWCCAPWIPSLTLSNTLKRSLTHSLPCSITHSVTHCAISLACLHMSTKPVQHMQGPIT